MPLGGYGDATWVAPVNYRHPRNRRNMWVGLGETCEMTCFWSLPRLWKQLFDCGEIGKSLSNPLASEMQ